MIISPSDNVNQIYKPLLHRKYRICIYQFYIYIVIHKIPVCQRYSHCYYIHEFYLFIYLMCLSCLYNYVKFCNNCRIIFSCWLLNILFQHNTPFVPYFSHSFYESCIHLYTFTWYVTLVSKLTIYIMFDTDEFTFHLRIWFPLNVRKL